MKGPDQDVRVLAIKALQELLLELQASTESSKPHSQPEKPAELAEVSLHGDDIDVTVVLPDVGQPVTLRLHVLSAALIPIRHRRRRKI